MLFLTGQRKGTIVLLVLLIGVLLIPRYVLPNRQHMIVFTPLEEAEMDSIPVPSPAPAKRTATSGRRQPLELNGADSVALVAVRGIGPYYASRIIRYRERLGGYYSVKQLKELNMKYFDVDSNTSSFTVDSTRIRKADLDTMSFKAVLRHPYLEYPDVQLIFNAKRKYGKVSCAVLKEHGVLPAHRLKKIAPYFK